MNRGQLKTLLDTCPFADFVDKHILNRRPWIFGSDQEYSQWKQDIRKALGPIADQVTIVGSAATGYSLSPLKICRPFRQLDVKSQDVSDIDFAVIDSKIFEDAWGTIVELDRSGRYRVADEDKQKIRSDVYWGYISGSVLPRGTTAATRVLEIRSTLGRHPPLRGYKINCRVYRRRVDLSGYHVSSVRRAKAALAELDNARGNS